MGVSSAHHEEVGEHLASSASSLGSTDQGLTADARRRHDDDDDDDDDDKDDDDSGNDDADDDDDENIDDNNDVDVVVVVYVDADYVDDNDGHVTNFKANDVDGLAFQYCFFNIVLFRTRILSHITFLRLQLKAWLNFIDFGNPTKVAS